MINLDATTDSTTCFTPTRAPAWFRYGIAAATTLILCSCRAVGPVGNAVPTANRTAAPSTTGLSADESRDIMPVAYRNQPNQTVHQPVVQALYMQDTHTPPPAFRQAEYQQRIIAAGYDMPADCQACACGCFHPRPAPQRDEFLCDGGDDGLAAAVREDWHLDGLGQEDTVAHYDTVDGRTVITPSNRVCVYAPRFGVVRREVDLHAYARYEMTVGFDDTRTPANIDDPQRAIAAQADFKPSIHRAENPPSLLRERQQLGELDREQRAAEVDGSLAPYADLQVIRAGTIDNEQKALVARASLAAITWAGDQSPQISIDSQQAHAAVGQRQAGVIYHQKDPTKPRLRLIKLASASTAQPGEEIEFTLRFDNIGSQVMGNVTIVDHLTSRLEYVPDSAKSSLDADFSLEPQSAGSAVLRWEIKAPLEAGQGGILQFRCKVL